MAILALANLKLRSKLLIVLVAISMVSVGLFGLIEFRATRQAMEEESFKKLTAVRELKAQQIEDYFLGTEAQLREFSQRNLVVSAMKDFGAAFSDTRAKVRLAEEDYASLDAYYREQFLPRLSAANRQTEQEIDPDSLLPQSNIGRYLQAKYISTNPHEVGEKHNLNRSDAATAYDDVHQHYHDSFRLYLLEYGFYDIFLVDSQEGNIVYSVFKEIDFGTSLKNGPHSDSGVARAYELARSIEQVGHVCYVDFEAYLPSYNSPAAFVSVPIFDDDAMIGVVVFQIPLDPINNIMTSRNSWLDVGLGRSGETYIVGSDYLMRNQSRFLIEDKPNYLRMIQEIGLPSSTISVIDSLNSSVGLQPVRTSGTEDALTGGTATRIFPDYRGVMVLSSYRPLSLEGFDWVIMSEIDASEAFAAIKDLRVRIIQLTLGLFGFCLIMASLFARSLSRPIEALTRTAESLSEGNLEEEVKIEGRDEVSLLAKSFESMRQSLKQMVEGLEDRVARRTQKLQDSEARMRTIVENAADGIVVIDRQGIVQSFSPSASRIFGFEEAEVVNENIKMLMPAEIGDQHDEYLQTYAETGKKHIIGTNREVPGVRKDGSRVPLELAVGEAKLSGENIYIGIVRDITERKKAEERIQETNKELDKKNQELELLSVKLAKYLSKQVYESIFSGKRDVRVESYRKNLTVFFSDVQGFTELTDRMEAEPLSKMLNQYLSEMSQIAIKHGGTIDKFIGDGIMIFFGDPETFGQREDAFRCVSMALEMRDHMVDLRQGWADQGITNPLHVRMGINSGYCTVGNFGSDERMDYTIVGGEVNLASRLETAAGADQILISNSTKSLIQERIHCIAGDEISVKGFAYPIQTFEVIAPIDESAQGLIEIDQELDGFTLKMNTNDLPVSERGKIEKALKDALIAIHLMETQEE